MKFRTVFVGGVHGAGKGYLIDALKNQIKIWHLTASSIIREEKNGKTDDDKIVLDPDENQDFLVSGLHKLLPVSNLLLLDGHFCLNKNENEFYRIPFGTFSKINLSKIFVVRTEPELILQNLQGRDGVSLTIEAITEFQNAELAYSEDIASRLSIPFQIGNSNHVERFIDFIQSDPSNYGST